MFLCMQKMLYLLSLRIRIWFVLWPNIRNYLRSGMIRILLEVNVHVNTFLINCTRNSLKYCGKQKNNSIVTLKRHNKFKRLKLQWNYSTQYSRESNTKTGQYNMWIHGIKPEYKQATFFSKYWTSFPAQGNTFNSFKNNTYQRQSQTNNVNKSNNFCRIPTISFSKETMWMFWCVWWICRIWNVLEIGPSYS